jgi:hypothetical protein
MNTAGMISDQSAYNPYSDLPNFSYNIISHLMGANEDFWRLIYYNDPDAWNVNVDANLTASQKASLIFNGTDDETKFRIFLDEGQVSAWLVEATIVRIFPYSIFSENRTVGTLTMAFDVFSHYRINTLSNYTTRIDTLSQIILQTFNGFYIGGLGKLTVDVLSNKQDRLYPSGQIPFKGKRITMSTKMG